MQVNAEPCHKESEKSYLYNPHKDWVLLTLICEGWQGFVKHLWKYQLLEEELIQKTKKMGLKSQSCHFA